MDNIVQIIFGLLGGLAVFIFGMNMMSECLQKAAGERMKAVLALLTKNPALGVLAGALTTAVLQSSSATTVMAIGFVSAGLMSLPQAVSIILGANIGTTLTAQIIAFKISDYIYFFLFLGFAVSFAAKSQKLKNIGQTVFAFGLLFLGIETMGDVMKPLAGSPVFTTMIARVAHIPVLGVLAGILMTLVVQSSSATIAVLQNFASQAGPDGVSSVLGLAGAIPILLGDNVGTTVTAFLASIGQTRDAKRTALAHGVFNLSGGILFLFIIKPYAALIQYLSPRGTEVDVISRQIANAHTGFNVIMTLLWLPLVWLLVKLVMVLMPGGTPEGGEEREASGAWYLDDNLLGQPAAALQLAAKEIMRCSSMVQQILEHVCGIPGQKNGEGIDSLMQDIKAEQEVHERITEYLANLFSAGVMTEEQATQTAGMMYVLSDVDRIALLCGEVADEVVKLGKKSSKPGLSREAAKDLAKGLKKIRNMYAGVVAVMEKGEPAELEKLEKRRDKVLELGMKLRKEHMKRVSRGECKAGLTVKFTRVLHGIERMGNSCINIADAVTQMVEGEA